ncbi:MAG: arginine--tRNA ligase [Candidatus Omnitrophica bacterium]|nr:arginine--tRNA ligase [Candidatus Omnitrophota bacterium]
MYYGGIENNIISFLEKSSRSVFSDLKTVQLPPHEFKPELEIPKDKIHGDLATNIAMRICKFSGTNAMAFADLLRQKMTEGLSATPLARVIDRLEVKPPGFINFFFSKDYLARSLLEIKRKKTEFGRAAVGRGTKLQIEFVSANPTGPLTIAHGRQAAIGDSLASILKFLGYSVAKEYYINDEGTQMDILGNSIRMRYRALCGIKEDFPEESYKGAYVLDIARAFKAKHKKKYLDTADLKVFRDFGLKWMMDDIRKDLKDFGVKFDVWYSQKALAKSGKVEKAIRFLKEKGYIYENEGAVWFKSTAFGDDKDRVVYKSDGKPTYLAPDIAYHLDKYKRGFKKLIDIWGPDHHGYIPRMRSAIKALGYSQDSLSVIIVQLATLLRGGQPVSMSTRQGEFITLREIMDEVGKDVTRFCFLMRRVSSHLDFDVEVVKKQSSENPVYYIQYAHARIWSILEYSRKKSLSTKFDSGLLKEAEEISLLRLLRQFPMVVSLSGKSLEPYMVLQYLQDLAAVFHSFYNKHRVVNDDPELTRARLVLVDCVRIVLANGLRLLGVSLPKKM